MKLKHYIFLTIVFYSCANSSKKDRTVELLEARRIALMRVDSLKQMDAFRFNDILLKETGTPNDTILISKYMAFIKDSQTTFWDNLAKYRISIIKARPARQSAEKKLFGTWEWVQTDGGWGFITTPETEGVTRRILIDEDYRIYYFENGIETGRDSFYISSVNEFPLKNRYHTIFNTIYRKSAEGFRITGTGNNATLTFYTPWFWGMDFPSEEYRRYLVPDTEIYRLLDIFPEFRYATEENTMNSIERYFRENFEMPRELIERGYQGKIYIQFVVEKNGLVNQVSVKRGIEDELDEAIVECVKNMPKWVAGKKGGKNVRSYEVIPISVKWLYGGKIGEAM